MRNDGSVRAVGLPAGDPPANKGICSKIPIPFSSDRESVSKGRKIAATIIAVVGFTGAGVAAALVSPYVGIAIAVVTLVAVFFALLTPKKKHEDFEVLSPPVTRNLPGKMEWDEESSEETTERLLTVPKISVSLKTEPKAKPIIETEVQKRARNINAVDGLNQAKAAQVGVVLDKKAADKIRNDTAGNDGIAH